MRTLLAADGSRSIRCETGLRLNELTEVLVFDFHNVDNIGLLLRTHSTEKLCYISALGNSVCLFSILDVVSSLHDFVFEW